MAVYPELKDQHVLITGGGSGIGYGLVFGFLSQGCRVSIMDNDQRAIEKLSQKLSKKSSFSSNFFYQTVDLREVAQVKQSMTKIFDSFGSIDILINNAADDRRHSLKSTEPEEWDNLIHINLRPYFVLSKEVVKEMEKKKRGVIINLSSNAFLLGLSGYPVYVTAKAAIMGLTKALARELGPDRIRVNCLIPGWVMTEKQKQKWVTEKALQECIDQQCLKETVEVEDIVQAALFLASDSSRMITGQNLVVDGGRY